MYSSLTAVNWLETVNSHESLTFKDLKNGEFLFGGCVYLYLLCSGGVSEQNIQTDSLKNTILFYWVRVLSPFWTLTSAVELRTKLTIVYTFFC